MPRRSLLQMGALGTPGVSDLLRLRAAEQAGKADPIRGSYVPDLRLGPSIGKPVEPSRADAGRGAQCTRRVVTRAVAVARCGGSDRGVGPELRPRQELHLPLAPGWPP